MKKGLIKSFVLIASAGAVGSGDGDGSASRDFDQLFGPTACLSAPAAAHQGPAYLGTHPAEQATFWSNDTQGIAHDDTHWFISKGYNRSNTRIYRVPLAFDLSQLRDPGAVVVRRIGIPRELKTQGFRHAGDLDQRGGFLFVPLEARAGAPAVAVFRAADLSLVGWDRLSQAWDRKAGWVAIRPGHATLWTSGANIDGRHGAREYAVDWPALARGQLKLDFLREVMLVDGRGQVVDQRSMQGGVFDDRGERLYLVNGGCCASGGDGHRIRVFRIDDGKAAPMLARSDPRTGPFAFRSQPAPLVFGCCVGEEPEGIDFFDTTGRRLPGVPDSQLHVLLLHNRLFQPDRIGIKHYGYAPPDVVRPYVMLERR